jgi:hypothetical protein
MNVCHVCEQPGLGLLKYGARHAHPTCAPLDVTLLLNNPKAAGVRLTINFEQRVIVLNSPNYDVATAHVRALDKDLMDRLARGEVVPEDILETRWGGCSRLQ